MNDEAAHQFHSVHRRPARLARPGNTGTQCCCYCAASFYHLLRPDTKRVIQSILQRPLATGDDGHRTKAAGCSVEWQGFAVAVVKGKTWETWENPLTVFAQYAAHFQVALCGHRTDASPIGLLGRLEKKNLLLRGQVGFCPSFARPCPKRKTRAMLSVAFLRGTIAG